MSDKVYLCLAPYCWGRGATPGEAVRLARRSYPKIIKGSAGKEMPYDLYQVNPDAFVDQAGNICAQEAPEKIREVRFVGGQRTVKEKGLNAPLPQVRK